MKQKGDTTITIPTYIRHHIHTEPNGHDIIIVSGEPGKEKLMTIQCRWPDRQRDASGRVHDK